MIQPTMTDRALRELDCKNRGKRLFCGGWQKNFFSSFLQNHFAGKAIPAIWSSWGFYLGRNDALNLTPNDVTNIPVSKCPTSAGDVGNRGFGHLNSADFLPVPFKYVLFCEF